MTAQIAEKLQYEGETLHLCSEPLDMYFKLAGVHPPFVGSCTALWRGYVGIWEITGDRLYLVGLSGTVDDGTEGDIETLFPGYPDRVFAHWFSGTLRAPRGKMFEYVHAGYASKFEQDLLITIEQGCVSKTEVRQNGVSDDPGAADEYGPAVMLVFGKEDRADEE